MTPEEKLCSRTWRMSRSAWLLFSILSFGFLTWVGFLLLGVTLRRRAWILSSVAYFTAGTAIFIVIGSMDTGTKEDPVTTPLSTAMAVVFFVFWLGGMVHSILSNRQWLKGLAFRSPRAWYTQEIPQQAPAPVSSGQHPLDRALQSSPAPAPARTVVPPQATTRPGDPLQTLPLDLNTASSLDIQRTLGFTPEWSEHIIATRTYLGRFDSPDQLLTAAKVPPHIYVGVKDRVIVTPPVRAASSSSRRRLDL